MKIAVTGSTGLIGSSLMSFLREEGHQALRLVRKPSPGFPEQAVLWSTDRGLADPKPVEGLDAVVHLAGENIAAGRWTEARKARLRDSRVQGTRALSESLARLSAPPKTLVCASA